MSKHTITTQDVEAELGPVLCAMLRRGDAPQAAPREAAAVSLFNVLSDDALNDYGLFTGDDTEAA
ncbi:MAG: hypothetical protein HY749_03855, partial [Gammaproteobacteria bacterium]|nr:hypothetical protein [Gammaproteobacteria bacterium]